MQSEIKNYSDMIFGWIPYSQFNDIKEITKGDTATIYSALWKGSIHFDPVHDSTGIKRKPNKKSSNLDAI